MDEFVIKRINELAQKAKTVGLTDEEIVERKRLREIYIAAFRNNLKQQLDRIVVMDKNKKSPYNKH